MCYSDDARPPLPPVVGGAASNHGDFHLTAADGNRFMAHHARAATPSGAGMAGTAGARGPAIVARPAAGAWPAPGPVGCAACEVV